MRTRSLHHCALLAVFPLAFIPALHGAVAVTGVSPASAYAGQTVVLTGSGFPTGASGINVTITPPAGNGNAVTFSAMSYVAINPPGTGRVTFQVNPALSTAAALPNTSISISGSSPSGAFTSSTYSSFTLLPAPVISNVSPGAAMPGASLTGVTINLKNVNWSPAAPGDVKMTFSGTGVTGTVSAFNSTTQQITANIAIAGNANTGAYNLTVTYGSTSIVLPAAFVVASSQVSLNSLSPNIASQCGTNVSVLATSSGPFFTGSTAANFGDGVTIRGIVPMGATPASQAQVTLNIDCLTPVGARTVTFVNGGTFASAAAGFTIASSSARVSQVNQASGMQGTNAVLTLTGVGTHWVQSGTSVSFGPGINVGNVTVASSTSLTVAITISPTAALGPYSITTVTNGEIAGFPNGFTVQAAAFPSITSVSATSGAQGVVNFPITVNTANANFTAAPLFDFGPNITVGLVSYTANSASTTISIDNVAFTGARKVLLSFGANILSFSFTVLPNNSTITSVNPTTGLLGNSYALTVHGSGTHWVQGVTTASLGFDITVNRVVVGANPSTAEVDITIPTSAFTGVHSLTMSTGGEIASLVNGFTVAGCNPSFSVTPASAMVGNSWPVIFNGKCTNWLDGKTFPVIDGQGVSIQNFKVLGPTYATATFVISATAPAAPQYLCPNRTITVTTPGSNGNQIVTLPWCVTSSPAVLTKILPYRTMPGAGAFDVTITGANTSFAQGVTTVTFGPDIVTTAPATVVDSTHVVAHIASVSGAAALGWRQAYVNTGNEQLAIGFLVDDPGVPATLSSISTASGAQGQTLSLTVTGKLTNFCDPAVAATLPCPVKTIPIFGQGVTVQSFAVVNSTTLTAVVQISPTTPVGPRLVDIITGAEDVSAPLFAVTPGIASLSGITVNPAVPGFSSTSPSAAVNQGAVVDFTINGLHTNFLQGATMLNFGSGITVNQFQVVDPATITGQMTVSYSAPTGLRSISAVTGGEVATSFSDALLVNLSQSSSVNITPTSGQQGTVVSIQANGIGTRWVNGVTSASFGNNNGLTVNSVTVTGQQAVISLKIDGTAYVLPVPYTLTMTTDHGGGDIEIETLNYAFSVAPGAAIITSVIPNQKPQGSTVQVQITGQSTNFRNGVTTAAFTPDSCPSPNRVDVNVANVAVTDATHATLSVAVSTLASTGLRNLCIATGGEYANYGNAFTVTPGVPTLNGVSPVSAQQGQTVTLSILGQFTNWKQGVTTATFGQGIALQSLTITDSTHATAQVSIDPIAYTGGRNVTMATNTEVVQGAFFSVTQSGAILTSISPTTANQGAQNVFLQISGAGTHWVQGQTQFQVTGGGYDITINGFQVTGATTAIADLTISPTAILGTRTIYISTGGENLSLANSLVITGGIPAITCVSPSTVTQGQTAVNVQLCGAYTQWTSTGPTPTQVNFDGAAFTQGQVLVNSNTSITAVVNVLASAATGLHAIQVRTANQVLTANINVISPAAPPVPYISYQTPYSALVGQTLDVYFTGKYTHWLPGSTNIALGAGITVNTFQVTSETSAVANITLAVNAGVGARTVTVTTGSEIETSSFTVAVGVPTLSLIDPGSILQGQTRDVDIVGQFTMFKSGATNFSFGPGIAVNSTMVFSSTSARVNLTASPTANTGLLTVTDLTATSTATGSFSVAPGIATILSVAPNTALQGSQLSNVTVTGFGTHWVQGVTSFNLGSGITASNVVVNGPTQATMTLTLDAGASLGQHAVTSITGGETPTLNNAFIVQPGTPILLSSTPPSAAQGTNFSLGILGQYTCFANGLTTVDLGAGMVGVTINVTSSNSITVTGVVDPVAYTGPRDITVTGGETTCTGGQMGATQSFKLYSAFGVTPGPAAITSLGTTQSGQGTTLDVIVNGTNSHFTRGPNSASFGSGITVNTITVMSDTQAKVNISISPQANPGLRSVSITTLGETAVGSSIFTVLATSPVLSFVNPNSAAQGQTLDVAITGTFTSFAGPSVVNFGPGITVNSVSVQSATALTANITISPTAFTGARNVSVDTVTLTSGFSVTSSAAGINTYLYVPSANDNHISAYTLINATGALIPVSGSPFNTGASPRGIVTSPSGRFAWVPNASDNTVSAYSINAATGALTEVTGSPFATGAGPSAIAVSPNGKFVYVTNHGAGTISGFKVNLTNGGLTPLAGSPVATGPLPAAVTLSPAGNLLYVVASGDAKIYPYEVNASTGALTPAVAAPFSPSLDLQGITFAPSGQYAWVAKHGPDGVLGFTVDSSTGAFTPLSGSPFAVGGIPSSIAATPSGQFVYAGNQGSNDISAYSVNTATGALSAVPGSPVSVGALPWALAVSPTGQYLYSANGVGSNNVSAFAVNPANGALTPVSGSPFTAGNGPRGIAVVLPGSALTGVYPGSGSQNTTAIPLVITGNGTHFDVTTAVSFGPGVTVASVNSLTPTYLIVSVNVASSAPLGPQSVTVTTGGEVVTLPNAFTVTAGTPTLSSVSPAAARQNDSNLIVSVNGLFTSFSNASTVSFGPGVTVTSVSAVNANTLSVRISVDPAATLGARDVTVTTGAETVTLANGFQVLGGQPVLTSLAPVSGRRGQTGLALTVSGLYTSFGAGTTASFSGGGITAASVSALNSQQAVITVNIDPAAALTTRAITLTTGSQSVTAANAFTVTPSLLTLNSSYPNGFTGVSYTQPVVSGGLPPYQINVTPTQGSPSFLSVNANSGAITFSAPSAGVYSFTVQVTDASAQTVQGNFSVTLFDPIVITTSSLAPGVIGVPYSRTVAASGGKAPFTFSVASGSLPASLTLDPNSGTIAGTPNTAATSNFTLKVTDAANQTQTAPLQIVIYSAPTITTTSLPAGRRSFAYNQTVAFSGGVPPLTASITSGALPANLTLNGNTGAITGTPTVAGTANFQVTVTDAQNNTAVRSLSLLVNDILQITTASPLPDGIAGYPYSQTIATQYGVAPVTFAVTAGSLPSGVTLDPATGLLHGTPSGPNTYNFTVQATDAVPVTVTQPYTWTINPTPVISSLSPNQLAAGLTHDVVVAAQNTHFVNGVTTVNFGLGITVNSVTVSGAGTATVNVTVTPNAAAGPRDITFTTGSEVVTSAGGFTVLAGLPTVTSVVPGYGKKNTTVSVTVTGQNLLGATFRFLSPIPNDTTSPGSIAITSNDGTTAVLSLSLGNVYGQYGLIADTSFGASANNAASQFAVLPGPFTATSSVVSTLNSANSWNNTVSLPAGKNSAQGPLVSVLNIANTWNNTVSLPAGKNSAQGSLVSVLNIANTWNNTVSLPAGKNSAQGALVSVLNIANTWNNTVSLPAGRNSAQSPLVSVLNSLWNPANTWTPTAGHNFAGGLAVSVCNRPSGCPVSTSQAIALPLTSLVKAPTAPAAPAADSAPSLASLAKFRSVVAGQTLRLQLAAPAGSSVDFEVNGAMLATVPDAPYELLFTVPAGVDGLTFRSLVHGAAGAVTATPSVFMPVTPDPGGAIEVPALKEGETVTLAASGLKAEYFALNRPLSALPDLTSLRPERTAYVTALNQPNPGGVFGPDPLGSGLAKDFAARFTGEVWVDADGAYSFWLSAHSGASLEIDGKPVPGGALALTRGWHKLSAEYFLAVGSESLSLEWQRPGGHREPLGPEFLRTDLDGISPERVPTAFDSVWIRMKKGETVRELPARASQATAQLKETNR